MAGKGRFAELLAIELAGGQSVKDAAAKVGCSERQAYRLSTSDEVTARVNELRSEAATRVVGQLSTAATAAVETLASLLAETNEPQIRLQASKAILTLSVPISQHFDLMQRLARVESRK